MNQAVADYYGSWKHKATFPHKIGYQGQTTRLSDPTHTKHFNHTHNMPDMCKYNMASQQNSTTQGIYSLGSEEPDITNVGLMTQHTEQTSNKHMRKLNLSEYRQLQMKRLRSLTIYKTLPRAQDRS